MRRMRGITFPAEKCFEIMSYFTASHSLISKTSYQVHLHHTAHFGFFAEDEIAPGNLHNHPFFVHRYPFKSSNITTVRLEGILQLGLTALTCET